MFVIDTGVRYIEIIYSEDKPNYFPPDLRVGRPLRNSLNISDMYYYMIGDDDDDDDDIQYEVCILLR